MNVQRQLKLWSRRRDGELDPRRAARLEADGERPAFIDEAEAAWSELGDRLRSQPIPTPPAEAMWQDVRREIRRQAGERRGLRLPLIRLDWAAIAASAVFVVALGYFGLRIARPPDAMAARTPVEWVEAELPGSSAMVYEDKANGAVVIWLITPAPDLEHGGPS